MSVRKPIATGEFSARTMRPSDIRSRMGKVSPVVVGRLNKRHKSAAIHAHGGSREPDPTKRLDAGDVAGVA